MDRKIKTILPLFVLISALSAGAFYTALLNPEISWMKKLNKAKISALSNNGNNRILVIGGSSVLFGIDAHQMSIYLNRPVINLGLHADMGALALLGYAEKYVKSGDLLILSIEPDLLSGKVTSRRLGNQFMLVTGNERYSLGGQPALIDFSPTNLLKIYIDFSSPGLQQIINHAGKVLLGETLYRYAHLEADAYGSVTKKVYLAHRQSNAFPVISSEWLEMLKSYCDNLDGKGIHYFYSMPWFETGRNQSHKILQYLTKINSVMPVILDYQGIDFSDKSLFADTSGHLSEKGAQLRSTKMAEFIRYNKIYAKGMLPKEIR